MKPKNLENRPVGTRSITVRQPNAANEGLLAAQVVMASDVRREVIDRALKSKEFTPDTLIGLSSKISEVSNTGESDAELKKLILEYADIIRRACNIFINIPGDFIRTEGNSHRTSLAASNPGMIANPVLTDINLLELELSTGVPADVGDTAYLRDVLTITAAFLNQN